MAEVYTIGLAKIEIGDIAADGGMGSSLDQIGYTNKDSCNFSQEDSETTEFYAEEVDDPVVSISRAGKTTFNFSVMNPDLEALQKLLGGKITGSGDSAVWNAPGTIPIIEKSVKITPMRGLIFEIPRMKIEAKINGKFSRSDIFVLDVIGTVLVPTNEDEAKIKASKVIAA